MKKSSLVAVSIVSAILGFGCAGEVDAMFRPKVDPRPQVTPEHVAQMPTMCLPGEQILKRKVDAALLSAFSSIESREAELRHEEFIHRHFDSYRTLAYCLMKQGEVSLQIAVTEIAKGKMDPERILSEIMQDIEQNVKSQREEHGGEELFHRSIYSIFETILEKIFSAGLDKHSLKRLTKRIELIDENLFSESVWKAAIDVYGKLLAQEGSTNLIIIDNIVKNFRLEDNDVKNKLMWRGIVDMQKIGISFEEILPFIPQESQTMSKEVGQSLLIDAFLSPYKDKILEKLDPGDYARWNARRQEQRMRSVSHGVLF
ncbi:MAG: hypothetical protein IJA14_04230 [Alphaproteobacteria bacterium]|nr:hypothetical protein [Alphaproteobacteria bacterium]